MTYVITLSKRAIEELEKLNEPYYSSIKSAINNLLVNPHPNGFEKLRGREGYRIRVSNYRIIYEIFDNQLKVYGISLGHRKNIYE